MPRRPPASVGRRTQVPPPPCRSGAGKSRPCAPTIDVDVNVNRAAGDADDRGDRRMPALTSSLNPRSEEFKASAAAMRALVDDLNARLAQVAEGGGAAARDKHTARGKLLPRERVEMLLDPDTPFLEIGGLAGLDMYKEKGGRDGAPGGGIVAGIGRVAGVECMIVCNDATVKGGTYFPITVRKHLRAQEI